jgi:hypothetical protein
MADEDLPAIDPPDKPVEFPDDQVVIGHVVLGCVVCAVGDFLLMAFARGVVDSVVGGRGGEFFIVLLLGVLAGEAGVWSVWLVFGPQRWWMRLAITTGMVCLLPVFMFAVAGGRGNDIDELGEMIGLTAASWSIVQLPMLALRFATRWRIVYGREADGHVAAGDQFSLRDMLIATAVVALILTLLRVSLRSQDRMAMEYAIAMAIAGTWNLVISGICLWAAFRTRSPGAVAAILVLVAFFVSVLLVALFEGDGEAMLLIALFHASAIAVLMLVLRAVKGAGYRLVRYQRTGDACVDEAPAEIVPPDFAGSPDSPSPLAPS